MGVLFGILIFVLIIAVAIYILISIFLNKMNKQIYGKGTALAFIPICNIYLLGKLTVGKWLGWILVGCVFLNATFTTEVNGVEKSYTILPASISSLVSGIYSLCVFILFIYAIIKYKSGKESN